MRRLCSEEVSVPGSVRSLRLGHVDASFRYSIEFLVAFPHVAQGCFLEPCSFALLDAFENPRSYLFGDLCFLVRIVRFDVACSHRRTLERFGCSSSSRYNDVSLVIDMDECVCSGKVSFEHSVRRE